MPLGSNRAIQIGLKGMLSEQYVASVLSIEDVTALAHKVCEAHVSGATGGAGTEMLADVLPVERPYMPDCDRAVLTDLGVLPGETADLLARLGKGLAA